MPKNKKPNRKPGVKKVAKRATAGAGVDGVPGGQDAKPVAKTYGSPKSVNSRVSPAMNQRSARSR